MSNPSFRFKLADAPCFASPTIADRVTCIVAFNGPCMATLSMSAAEARGMANALYEAADAAEKLLPVAAPAPVAA